MSRIFAPRPSTPPPSEINMVCPRHHIPVGYATPGDVGGVQVGGQILFVDCLKERCPLWIRVEHEGIDGDGKRSVTNSYECADAVSAKALHAIAGHAKSMEFLARIPNQEAGG